MKASSEVNENSQQDLRGAGQTEWPLLTRCMLGSVVLAPSGCRLTPCRGWATAASPLPGAPHAEGVWRLEEAFRAIEGQAEPSFAVLWAPLFRPGLQAPNL